MLVAGCTALATTVHCPGHALHCTAVGDARMRVVPCHMCNSMHAKCMPSLRYWQHCTWQAQAGADMHRKRPNQQLMSAHHLVLTVPCLPAAVAHRVTGEVYLSGELDRGINPADSGWTYSGGSGEAGCVLQLSKLNLELLQRPWQHSESWWPRLLLVHPQVAWDDGDKDYSDLPEPVRRVHQVGRWNQ